MEEEALQDAYKLFADTGYAGDLTKFKELISTNKEALKDSYKLFVDTGYNGDEEEFSKLLGITKKEQAVSTESPSDSAQEQSDSAITEETQEIEETTSASQLEQVEDLPVDESITELYDRYRTEGAITLPQQEKIRAELVDQKAGDRSIWEDINAFATGMLTSGMMIPMYHFDTKEGLEAKRLQKNKVDFLSELPADKVKELNEFAINRTVELNNRDKNILAENIILEEKGKAIVANLKHQLNTIKQIQDSGKIVPEEGLQGYEDLYQELEGISRLYNQNVDIIESDQEDVGDFYEELELLKKNYGGLDYYKEVTRLATADMLGGLMEFGISSAEMGSQFGIPNVAGHQYVREFRAEIASQRELLRPQLAVGDIENASDMGKWFLEQVATQLPVITVLAATGGTIGLSALGASAGGQKMGDLREENILAVEETKKVKSDIDEMTRLINEREFKLIEREEAPKVDAEGNPIYQPPVEYDVSLEEMKKARVEAVKEFEKLSERKDYTQLEIYLAGAGFGLAEALSERVSLGILSKGRRSLQAINKSGLQKEFKKGIKIHAKETLFAGASEGASETGNQWVQNLIDMHYLDKKDVHIFDGTADALASGAAMGVGMRLVPTLIGLGGKAFMDKTVRRRIVANTNKIEGYLSELESNPNLSPESKKFLQKRVDNVTKETQEEIISVLEKLPEIGEKGIKRLIVLDKKANGILRLVKELETTNLSEEAKNDIKIDYKKQIDKINEEKNTLLDIKVKDKKLTFLERQGFDDKSDKMRGLIFEIEYQAFQIGKAETVEKRQKIVDIINKRKSELQKLREDRLAEGGKGWWLKEQKEETKANKIVEDNKSMEEELALDEVLMQEKIDKESKEDIKLSLIPAKDLVNSKDPVGNKNKHIDIKDRYKKLRALIDCL